MTQCIDVARCKVLSSKITTRVQKWFYQQSVISRQDGLTIQGFVNLMPSIKIPIRFTVGFSWGVNITDPTKSTGMPLLIVSLLLHFCIIPLHRLLYLRLLYYRDDGIVSRSLFFKTVPRSFLCSQWICTVFNSMLLAD